MVKRWLQMVAAGPWQSAGWAALLAIFAVTTSAAPVLLLSPLLFVASGAVVVLTVLRQSLGSLWRTLAIAGAVLLLAGYATGLGGGLLAMVLIVFWVPLVLAARGWRKRDFAVAVKVVVALTLVTLLAGHQSGFQPETFLDGYSQAITQQLVGNADSGDSVARIELLFGWVERFFWGWMSATFGLLWMCSMLLGRYWHALLDNPSAFSREFAALRLGPVIVLAIVVAVIAGIQGAGTIAWEVATLLSVGVFWQGLACVQAVFNAREMSGMARVGFYCLLVVFALQVALVLVFIGLLDGFLNFRSRLAH